MVRDVAGVLADASDRLREERVLEGEPEEVQSGRDIHHAPMLDGVAVLAEDRVIA